jgi:hypothetical protein
MKRGGRIRLDPAPAVLSRNPYLEDKFHLVTYYATAPIIER